MGVGGVVRLEGGDGSPSERVVGVVVMTDWVVGIAGDARLVVRLVFLLLLRLLAASFCREARESSVFR